MATFENLSIGTIRLTPMTMDKIRNTLPAVQGQIALCTDHGAGSNEVTLAVHNGTAWRAVVAASWENLRS